MPVDTVTISFRSVEGEFPLDAVVGTLLDAIPGAHIADDDWYANARTRVLRIAEEKQLVHPEIILRDIDDAEKHAGRRKILAIPHGLEIITCDICKHQIVLISESSLAENHTVDAIVATLETMNIVERFDRRVDTT